MHQQRLPEILCFSAGLELQRCRQGLPKSNTTTTTSTTLTSTTSSSATKEFFTNTLKSLDGDGEGDAKDKGSTRASLSACFSRASFASRNGNRIASFY
jgi:hypothetical protein